MDGKRKLAEANPLPIKAEFVFNRPIDWVPRGVGPLTPTDPPRHVSTLAQNLNPDHSSQPSGSRAPTTTEELQQQFAAFIQSDITALTKKGGKTVPRAEQVKIKSAIRALALDPSSKLHGLNMANMNESASVDDFFELQLSGYVAQARSIIDIWAKDSDEASGDVDAGGGGQETPIKETPTKDTKGKAVERGRETKGGKASDRSKRDKSARRKVPPWYEKRCVLTGVETVDAAHIVDVKATKFMGDPAVFWGMLRLFWPLERIEELKIAGCEKRNILPLQPTAHRLWDQHRFALRPIQHPTDPDHRIYLQVVWFKDRHAEIGLADDGHGCSKETNLSDRGRKMEDPIGAGARYVVHGDVYELSTSDSEGRPLPNLTFFHIRYAVQQLFAGQQAAGALRAIFDGDPPDDDTPSPALDEAFIPSDWDNMLQDALDLGILSDSTEAIWRRCILEWSHKQHLQEVQKYRQLEADIEEEAEEDG
ncbi:hypothetical protein B0T16DRAFT_463584 [Cercophora newfieldiana]|uniref:HNH nuclease domain-containing protein n=1 Tax=Cercophora newfieldiana TaxID=92897 RepID=A0AA39XTJ0_9PEZI|nr:hypothetical protein B0T16DRAFT_463584 [Cercophora newfieldiana]